MLARLRTLFADRRGGTAVVIAATLPLMLGGVALAIDTVQWTLARRLMQRQADSAALAGVFALAQGQNAEAVALQDIARNPGYALDSAPVIERGPGSGASAGDPMAVRVALSTTLRLPFAGLFLPDGKRVSVEATANFVQTSDLCMLALASDSSSGITMNGNTDVTLRCGMAANSIGSNGISAGGSSSVIASPVMAVGGLQPNSRFADGTVFQPYSVSQPDPFASLPDPSVSGTANVMSVRPNRRGSFSPGVYRNVDIKGIAELSPGTYFIDGGTFSVGSQGELRGTGVTIVLTSRTAASNGSSVSGININGGAEINLTAPTSGTYKGVLFYQDRRASNQTHKINGNSDSRLQGALYFPSSTLEFTGTSGMEIDCLQMVALYLEMRGNSDIKNICPPEYGAIAGRVVRLVG